MFFGVDFCTEQLQMICTMDFDMFFGILTFKPNRRFSTGYSLCMIADFKNPHISRISRVFLELFFSTEQL